MLPPPVEGAPAADEVAAAAAADISRLLNCRAVTMTEVGEIPMSPADALLALIMGSGELCLQCESYFQGLENTWKSLVMHSHHWKE